MKHFSQNHIHSSVPRLFQFRFPSLNKETLTTWLAQPTFQQQRHWLEQHREILHDGTERWLRRRLHNDDRISAQPQLRESTFRAFVIIKMVRRNGGTIPAITEAYVQIFGGFTLDLEPWLEDAQQEDWILKSDSSEMALSKRIALWQKCIQRAYNTDECPSTIIAELLLQHATALQDGRSVAKSQRIKEALQQIDAAQHIYSRETYPYQWAKAQALRGQTLAQSQEGRTIDNIDTALAMFNEPISFYPMAQFPITWARITMQKGIAYVQRSRVVNDIEVETGIKLLHQALTILTREKFSEEWGLIQNNLGTAYLMRNLGGGSFENLQRGVDHLELALQVRTRDRNAGEWASTLNSLAGMYIMMIDRNREESIEKGIEALHQALTVRTYESNAFDWARTTANLAAAYAKRIHGNRQADIDEAIRLLTDCLKVFTREALPYEWARMHNNLSQAYRRRTWGDQSRDFELAVESALKALTVWTRRKYPFDSYNGHLSLGEALAVRIQGKREENLTLAARAITRAVEVARDVSSSIEDQWYTLQHLAKIQGDRGLWSEAEEVYREITDLEDLIIAAGIGEEGRDASLRLSQSPHARHAYCLTQMKRPIDAVIEIERGRSRSLVQALALDTADSSQITQDVLRARYEKARYDLLEAKNELTRPIGSIVSEEERRKVFLRRSTTFTDCRMYFDDVVNEIRQASAPADFLQDTVSSAALQDIVARFGNNHAFVYIMATPWGGMAHAILGNTELAFAGRFQVLELPALTEEMIQSLLQVTLYESQDFTVGGFALGQEGEIFDRLQAWEGDTLRKKTQEIRLHCNRVGLEGSLIRSLEAFEDLAEAQLFLDHSFKDFSVQEKGIFEGTIGTMIMKLEIERCSPLLSENMLQPIVMWLQKLGVQYVTWIPTGKIATFPITTFLIGDDTTVEDILPSSIAPSIRAMRKSPTVLHRSGVTTFGDTRGDLPDSEREAKMIALLAKENSVSTKVYLQESATRQNIVHALESSLIVSIACHGQFDHKRFLQSKLLLAQYQSLTMANLLARQSNLTGLRLLILSACQTAMLDLDGAIEEAYSLTTAFLQARVTAVLSAWWAIQDRASYLLMSRFVAEWLPHWNEEPPAEALVRARKWLRHATLNDIAEWERQQLRISGVGRLRRGFLLRGRQQMNYDAKLFGDNHWFRDKEQSREVTEALSANLSQLDSTMVPYAHPFYWAGFQITGW